MPLQKHQVEWLQLLANQPAAEQYKIIRSCNTDLLQDLNELIQKIIRHKKLKDSPESQRILKKHRTFLRNFTARQSVKKKKGCLLRKVKGGFLGVIIPTLVSLASTLIPSLIGE